MSGRGRTGRSLADKALPPDDLPHRMTGDAGLGPAILRELVELMGGQVEAESTPGEGSHFTVSLQIAVHDASRPALVISEGTA